MTRSQSASEKSTAGARRIVPALLTRMSMRRVSRRDHALAVGDQQVPGLVGFAEQVDDSLGLGEAEVQVALGPAVVRVGGHGVPGATGVQRGHAEDDLAAADAVRVDVLVDRTAVRGCWSPSSRRLPSPGFTCVVGKSVCAGAEKT
jgi:hypothetical protein